MLCTNHKVLFHNVSWIVNSFWKDWWCREKIQFTIVRAEYTADYSMLLWHQKIIMNEFDVLIYADIKNNDIWFERREKQRRSQQEIWNYMVLKWGQIALEVNNLLHNKCSNAWGTFQIDL